MTQRNGKFWLLSSCHQLQLIALCRNVFCAETAVPVGLHISIIHCNPSLTNTFVLHGVPDASVITSSTFN